MSRPAGIARFRNWEPSRATNDTELTFDGNLVLGDAGSGTGTLIDRRSQHVFGGGANAAVAAFTQVSWRMSPMPAAST